MTVSRLIILVIMLQLFGGLINVLLLAPVWMQLVHLFLADTIWICLVLFAAIILSKKRVDLVAENI
jgi:heme A synthase